MLNTYANPGQHSLGSILISNQYSSSPYTLSLRAVPDRQFPVETTSERANQSAPRLAENWEQSCSDRMFVLPPQ